jgi:prefoldin beta subunit
MEIPEESRKDIMDFQSMQQQLQYLLMQKQQAQLQLAELDRAKDEVNKSTSDVFYRGVGGIMIPKTKAELTADLANDSEGIKLRVDLMGKQEERMKSRLNALSEKLSELESKLSGGNRREGTTVSKPKRN